MAYFAFLKTEHTKQTEPTKLALQLAQFGYIPLESGLEYAVLLPLT